MERKEKEGVEIDLKRVLIAMMYRWWIIVLAVVLFGTAAFSYAWFGMTPVYSSNVKLYVNNNYVESPGYSSAQIMAAKDLAATYMVILESRNVLEEVSKRVDGRYTYEQLRSMVSASAVNETEVFQVTVTGQNYKDVAKIANCIAEVLPDRIKGIVEGSSVRVVDGAVENPNPVGPSYKKYALLGAAIGLVLSVVVVALVDMMDTTIKSEEYLIQAYGKIPLLAVIPGADSASGYSRGYYGKNNRRKAPASRKTEGNVKKPDDRPKGGSV